ncbi:MAG: HEAT repeat domain-containing protein [Gemmatimonadales bacterium]|nr:HEAT repeat domain-containing protein [Gemmatimonadales bacterium]
MRALSLVAAAMLLECAPDAAQNALLDRIRRVDEGVVRLSYAVRDGICGDGATFIRDHARGEENYISFEGRWNRSDRYKADRVCEPGPARVAIHKSGGMVTRVNVYVGRTWDRSETEVTDLGEVAAAEAARALIGLAALERRAGKAIFASTIADSVVIWPQLLTLAKNDDVAISVRKDAVFWISQAAGDAATKGLADLAENDRENRDVRDQAVFAISQRPADEGVPVLIRLAKTNPDPSVRRKALFWLGQSDDPRALKVFEEILTKG